MELYKLPEGWRWVKLEEICVKITDGTHGSPKHTSSGIPLLSAKNIKDGKIEIENCNYTTEEEFMIFEKRIGCKKDDVLLTIVGTIGETAVVHEDLKAVFLRSVCILRPKVDLIDSSFLAYVLRSKETRKQMIYKTKQVAQPGIYLKDIKNLQIPLPPLPEQKRIVARIEELFGKIDKVKKLRKEALEQTKTLLKATLYKIFSKADEKGWRWVKLGEVCEVVAGFGFPKKFQGKNNLKYPFIKVNDMNLPGNEIFISYAENYVDETMLREMNVKIYPSGTIIFPKIGGAVATNKKRILRVPATFDNNIMGVIPKKQIVHTLWVYHYLEAIDLMKLTKTTTMPSIRKTVIQKLQIPLPPLPEQKRIVAYLDKIQQKVQSLQALQETTEEEIKKLKESILHKAFRGEL